MAIDIGMAWLLHRRMCRDVSKTSQRNGCWPQFQFTTHLEYGWVRRSPDAKVSCIILLHAATTLQAITRFHAQRLFLDSLLRLFGRSNKLPKKNLNYISFSITWLQPRAVMSRIEQITVRRLVQRSLIHSEYSLRVNEGYARIDSAWSIQEKSRYLQQVMHGTEISVLIINITENNSYIVDGAARIGTLVDFQQGKIPMVLRFGEVPDAASFSPHGVAAELYAQEQFPYKLDTPVEIYYSGLAVEQKKQFLQAGIDVIKLRNYSLDEEKKIYWQNNNICPPSPVLTSNYDESCVLQDISGRMCYLQINSLKHLMNMMHGPLAIVARAELLRFAKLMLARPSVRECGSQVTQDVEHNP
jgi:hypothetical protein